ncbi:MAG: hypothetical protein J6D18_03130 [Erysipelotrichaceae bacterium]|nr:hypothetical protein [Erysipelotrichaceae bacterium]
MEPKEWMMNKKKMMDPQGLSLLIRETSQLEQDMLDTLNENEVYDYMVSKMNFCQRKQVISCQDMGVHIRIGDICFIDYGLAYLWEIGYQHFGLVLSMKNGKAFVVPVSGSARAFRQAAQKEHMMRLPLIRGLNKPSVLYINDAKWINTARIIDVKAHIDAEGALFKSVKQQVQQMI